MIIGTGAAGAGAGRGEPGTTLWHSLIAPLFSCLLACLLPRCLDGDTSEESLRAQELALTRLGQLYRDTKDAKKLAEAVRSSRSLLASIAKAKTAKLSAYEQWGGCFLQSVIGIVLT